MKIRYLPFKESTCQVDRDEDHCLFQIVSSWGSSNRDGGDCSFIDCKERKSHVSLSTDCSNKLTFLGQGSHREIRSSGLVYRAKPWVVKSDHLPRFSAEPVSLIEVRSGGNRGFHFSDSAQAAITKYHWLDCLKNRHFFPHSFGVWEVHYQGALLAGLIPAESPLAGSQVPALLLYPHMTEKAIMLVVSLLIRALITFLRAPPMT